MALITSLVPSQATGNFSGPFANPLGCRGGSRCPYNSPPLPLPMPLLCPLATGARLAVGAIAGGIDVVHFDPSLRLFKPVLEGLSVEEVVFSPDRQWMLYSKRNQLWRSRPDGSDRRKLIEDPTIANIHSARWSPDSKHILFFEDTDGGLKGAILLVSADGGLPNSCSLPTLPRSGPIFPMTERPLSSPPRKERHSPSPGQGLYLLDSAQRRSAMLPGSEGLEIGRWSPDGRFLAASGCGPVCHESSRPRHPPVDPDRSRHSPLVSRLVPRFRAVFSGYSFCPESPSTASNPTVLHRNAPTASRTFCQELVVSAVPFGVLPRTALSLSRSTMAAEISMPSPSESS